MVKDELLIVKRDRSEKLKIKVCDKELNHWSPNRYEKVIANRDYNLLAFVFYDLNAMGYNVHKAYAKFKALIEEPDLFFMK